MIRYSNKPIHQSIRRDDKKKVIRISGSRSLFCYPCGCGDIVVYFYWIFGLQNNDLKQGCFMRCVGDNAGKSSTGSGQT